MSPVASKAYMVVEYDVSSANVELTLVTQSALLVRNSGTDNDVRNETGSKIQNILRYYRVMA